MSFDFAIATNTFKGDYLNGGEYSFTKGNRYSSCMSGGSVFIMDDNGNGVKFSLEETTENFVFG